MQIGDKTNIPSRMFDYIIVFNIRLNIRLNISDKIPREINYDYAVVCRFVKKFM